MYGHANKELQHDVKTPKDMTSQEEEEYFAIALKLPYTQDDWSRKRRATDRIMDDIGGIVTRVGDETVGKMWSLCDGQDT